MRRRSLPLPSLFVVCCDDAEVPTFMNLQEDQSRILGVFLYTSPPSCLEAMSLTIKEVHSFGMVGWPGSSEDLLVS